MFAFFQLVVWIDTGVNQVKTLRQIFIRETEAKLHFVSKESPFLIAIVRSRTSTFAAQLRVKWQLKWVLIKIASTAIVHILCLSFWSDTICDFMLERKILQFVLLNVV